MENDLSLLILSCGTRNKIVQYFKEELNGSGLVMATDSSHLAPALYEADKHFIVPRIDEEGYLEKILSICKDYNIKGVLSLIDPELTLLAEYKQKFLDIGTLPIISEVDVIKTSFDKYKMFKFLRKHGFKTIKSYIDKEEFYNDVEKGKIDYPVFIKPVTGSASLNINKVTSKEEVELLFSQFNKLMIQEFMDGIEYGVDAYIDMFSSRPVSIFIKEKLNMRAGETDKSVSIKNDELFSLITDFIKKTDLKGIIDIDVFKVNEEYYISEVNPRFGGGYPHAHGCDVNMIKMIVNNVVGNENIDKIGQYKKDIYMLKYSDMKIIGE